MSFARRIGVALAIAGSVVPIAAAASQRTSPGYTFRLRITGRVTEPDGRTTDYVAMSGRAIVTGSAGRLDIDEASRTRGAVAEKDSYILYDSTSMTFVSPRSRQIVRLSLENLEPELRTTSVSDMRVAISDVSANVEELGPGEPILGMATTRRRITQDYKVASTIRSSTERIVQEIWMADSQKGFTNPFARLRHLGAGPEGRYRDVIAQAAEGRRARDRGALKTVTTNTSTSSRNQVTQTVTTMEVTDLQAENVDDDILVPPTDYQLVDVSELTRTAPNSQGAQAGRRAKAAKPAATGNAAADAKQDMVKLLHGMGRRP
jgi:hypothetical protein